MKQFKDMEKFCGCIFMQTGVFVCLCISWTVWMGSTLMYIPYILFFSPKEPLHEAPMAREGEEEDMIPSSDYGTGRISAVIILIGLCVDSFALIGLYQKYKLKTDMLVPWLFFYILVVPGLLSTGVIVALYCVGEKKYFAAIPIASMADRKSRKHIIAIGIFLWSLMTIACGLTRNFWQILFARIWVGVGEATLSPSTTSLERKTQLLI